MDPEKSGSMLFFVCYYFPMSSFDSRQLSKSEFPPLLAEIPQPPKELWLAGNLPEPNVKLLAVVGSRKYTSYGKQVIEHLLSGLSGYPIGIISGLALGVDAIAHETALKNNLYTLAVPGSGLGDKVLYPATNRALGRRIIESGGGLLSELAPETKAALWTFPRRNRIMAGMSHATLLIEAGAKSGTLITARMCVDYNRELLVVPGSIFSKNSEGVHQFLKLGATPVTTSEDILQALTIEIKAPDKTLLRPNLTLVQSAIIDLLHEPTERDTLMRKLNLSISEAGVILMEMEMMGYISEANNIYTAKI